MALIEDILRISRKTIRKRSIKGKKKVVEFIVLI